MSASAEPVNIAEPLPAPVASALIATGTAHGRWADLAAAVAKCATPVGNVAADARTPVVAFVDGPAHALAAWLVSHPDGEPVAGLAEWCEAAQRLLRLAHGQPQRCVLVDVNEVARYPHALRTLLGDRFGVRSEPLLDRLALPSIDPVALALAAGFVHRQRQAQTLHAQLRASCMPLSAVEVPDLGFEAVDFGAAVLGWRQLSRAHEDVRAGLTAQIVALQADLAHQVEQGRTVLAAAQAEADEWLLQLHRTQEELEALQIAHRAPHPSEGVAERQAAEIESLRQSLAQQSRQHADQSARLVQAAAESNAVRQQLQAAQTLVQEQGVELAELRGRLSSQDEALAQAADVSDALRRQLQAAQSLGRREAELLQEVRAHSDVAAAARMEAELLQIQLHTLQEELAHHYLALKGLDETPPLGSAMSRFNLRIGHVAVGESAHSEQHHHLQFELHDVRTPHRSLSRLTVRLAEHVGRPGLILFAPNGEDAPLAAWQASGEEAGRRFMTLVPADEPSQAGLQRMATADWEFVNQLVAHLLHRLGSDGVHGEAVRWRAVARQLQQQLRQLPPRLRYSAITVSPENGRDGRVLVQFSDVVFGNEARDDFRLSWRPGDSSDGRPGSAPLQLRLDAGSPVPPLAGWPFDAQGHPAGSVDVPVGPGLSAVEKRRRWASLWPADRDFVLAVLDALPACAAQADRAERAGLEAAARALLRDAQAAQRQMQWRRILRAVARRLRVG